jgi:hypothetical protein
VFADKIRFALSGLRFFKISANRSSRFQLLVANGSAHAAFLFKTLAEFNYFDSKIKSSFANIKRFSFAYLFIFVAFHFTSAF